MAYFLPNKSLSKEVVQLIEQQLTFTPVQGFNPSKWTRKEAKTIKCYTKVNDGVYLPYIWSSINFNFCPNIDIDYPMQEMIFTGELRENQIAIMQEVQIQLDKTGCTTLDLPPGTGKTILGAYIASLYGLLTVVLCNRLTVARQWVKTFHDNTDASVYMVGETSDSDTPNVLICMQERVCKLPREYREQVGLLIIDEAHTLCTESGVPALLGFTPKYIVVETATLERDDEMHCIMHSIAGTESVSREIIKPFKVIKVLTGVSPDRVMGKNGYTNYVQLVKDTWQNERRQNIIMSIIKDNANRKTLVLSSSVEYSKLLCASLLELDITADYLCGNKKSYQDSQVLVGTTGKIGTGFDPANFCSTYKGVPFDLLIMACSIKKYSTLQQNVGRIFRCDYPVVYHIVDEDPIYHRHWNKCEKWYKSKNGEIAGIVDLRTKQEEPEQRRGGFSKELIYEVMAKKELAIRKHNNIKK